MRELGRQRKSWRGQLETHQASQPLSGEKMQILYCHLYSLVRRSVSANTYTLSQIDALCFDVLNSESCVCCRSKSFGYKTVSTGKQLPTLWRTFPPPLQGLIRGVSYSFTSPNIIRVMKSNRILGAERNACRILVGKRERKKTFGRPRNRWKDVVKIRLLRRIQISWFRIRS